MKLTDRIKNDNDLKEAWGELNDSKERIFSALDEVSERSPPASLRAKILERGELRKDGPLWSFRCGALLVPVCALLLVMVIIPQGVRKGVDSGLQGVGIIDEDEVELSFLEDELGGDLDSDDVFDRELYVLETML